MISDVVPIIVLLIICFQLFFFTKNLRRMNEFKNIFSEDSHWSIHKNKETGFVSGIGGEGNRVFLSIKNSINKYLGNNSGSVIDFHLLKDAVDRHCDSVENDINVQTPLPLYCGLVGTMSGVIVGLVPLISTGALIFLLSGHLPSGVSKQQMEIFAAQGINELLSGVAWAMSASICGIVLTTLNSIFFKSFKLKEENGKNSFLAWMQSYLLPELPSDTSDALNRLVRNLNSFNKTFATNTSDLKIAFDKVNSSYKIQAEVIKAVHDMDVMKMAKVNIKVLEELQKSTEKLEQFNEYLSSVKGYTDTIQNFTQLFDSESERLHVLEEIKEFFNRHKAEISKDVTDSNITLNDSLKMMKEATVASVNDFRNGLVDQTESLKDILKKEKVAFEKLNLEIKTQFTEELSKTPTLIKNIEAISIIPNKLELLLNKIDDSNSRLLINVEKKILETKKEQTQKIEFPNVQHKRNIFPKWLSFTIAIFLFLITIACVTNTVYNVLRGEGYLTSEEMIRNQSPIKEHQYKPNYESGEGYLTSKEKAVNQSLSKDNTYVLDTIVDSSLILNKSNSNVSQ